MSGESVKVAVRVRPFNSREKDRNSKCCVEMIGALTQISDPDNPGQPPKEFTFDFSYWSHDQFKEDPDSGYLLPTGDKYADQRKVFDDLGAGVLDNAFKGFNCSLFAYGQTGAGKSYSMVGYGNNKGIVPITCDELFKKIDAGTNASVKYQVTFSMLEIYNEQVRDLLTKDNPKGGLQVRQNPKEGSFFVQGLKKVAVGSYKEIEKRTEEGTSNRTVAATQMNATSSRAHTVVTIQFDQIQKNEAGQETKKTSVINLVDLAGSERADSTGATGDRLKEGANINKSLSALGNVISALADLSMGKKKVMVPYRDSVLTKLLQNALGGNSKTIMIAALSPADINYDETLGTLRYADRAKKIKNKAVVNENPMDKLIRELREENEKLKKSLGGGGMIMEGSAGMTEEEKEKMRKEMEESIRAQLQANMENMMSWDEKLQHARSEDVQSGDDKFDKSKPHLVNLNEDPMLSGVIKRTLNENETVIGRKGDDSSPDIVLSGLSIKAHHAVIAMAEREVTIKPGAPGAKTKVNGMPLTGERVLKHLDRVLFGSNHLYYFVNPLNTEKSEGSPDKIDYEVAQKEIAEAKGFATGMTAGLSKDQQVAQEQVLELLPMISEVNAISEELDKHKAFEVFLVSGASRGDNSAGTKVQVKMKDMLNGNVWIWERGKFTNRRYLMQDMYQKFLDGDDISKIPKDEDPFEDPPEDTPIGTANVFLQSLSYALDFDDRLDVTDYAGKSEGNIVINVTPCNQTGKPLDEEFFVEDPLDLLGKPYHYKVLIRNAEVKSARFSHGIYCKFKPYINSTDAVESPTIKGTLSPEFNFAEIHSIPSITQEDLDWFDSGCISFELYGKQVDSVPDASLLKMTTKELREMEHITKPSMSRTFSIAPGDSDNTQQLKSELVTLRRKYEKLQKKEKRIQDLCEKWRNSPQEDFKAFFQAIDTAAYYQTGRFKQRANMVHLMLKAQKNASANGGEVKMEKKVTGGSRACTIM